MNLYYKIKIFLDYILPITSFAFMLTVIGVFTTISVVKENRIKNFFVSHGYKRELFDVASVGNGAFYGWVRESDNKRVDDRNIKGLSFKQIKEKYE